VPHSSRSVEWDLPRDFLPALALGLLIFFGDGRYRLD
jgi:hypothetical protein